jgi:hypothetical protein
MKIEAMAGYPGSLRIMKPTKDVNITQLQGQIYALTKKIQELNLPKIGRLQFWCTGCYMEGHATNECSRLRGIGPSNTLMGPPLVG